jgi:hypothetical protein
MADQAQSNEPETSLVTGPAEYVFAAGVDVVRGEHMVYLDFIQRDPRRTDRARAVARIIMHPDAIPAAIDALSSVRDV